MLVAVGDDCCGGRPSSYGSIDLDVYLFSGGWLDNKSTLGSVVAPVQCSHLGVSRIIELLGAILLYLTIFAATFWRLFHTCWRLVPNAFLSLSFEDSPALASKLIYFSFVTLDLNWLWRYCPGTSFRT